MFEPLNSRAYSQMQSSSPGNTSLDAAYLFAAQDHFTRAHNWAGFYRFLAWLFKKRARLIALSDYELQIHNRYSLGLQPIEIRSIQGTEGKANDFDARFNPRNRRTYHRWIGIAIARQRFEVLPPVDLLNIGSLYFVRDGHHRISVARAFGDEVVDALVTRLEITPPIPWEIETLRRR